MRFETISCRSVLVCLAVSLLLFVLLVPSCLAFDSIEVNEALVLAENDLASVYEAIAEAESVGANVSPLLNKLSIASGFLSEAYVLFRAGNYQDSISLVELFSIEIEGVADDASIKRGSADKLNRDNLFLTATESVLGLGLLFVLGFFGWRFLKKIYLDRVLELRPVVEENR